MTSERRRARSWGWPLAVVALLVGGAGANVALLVVATSDASFSVERDYYQKALAWDETMAQEARNADLGWSLAASLDAPAGREGARLSVRVTDRDGAAVAGAAVLVEALHNARASEVLTAPLVPAAPGGYTATLPLRRPGIWELRFRITRGPAVFTGTITRELEAPPGRGTR